MQVPFGGQQSGSPATDPNPSGSGFAGPSGFEGGTFSSRAASKAAAFASLAASMDGSTPPDPCPNAKPEQIIPAAAATITTPNQ
jgi:hypothetical protein